MQLKEIYVQNLVVLGGKGEWGESGKTEIKDSNNPVPRLLRHFSHCAQFAAEAHKDAQLIDTEISELITRLTMSEFSCYTKDKPLTLAQYKELIAAIPGIVKDLAPNIHLVLGTFAVAWPDGTIHNCGLHVQSSKTNEAPLIHHFEKHHPHYDDPCYFKENGEAYPLYKYTGKDYKYSPDVVLQGTGVSCNDFNQTMNAIKITTRDGQEFIVAIDICLDHEFQTALASTTLLQIKLFHHNHSVPERGDHVISSDSVLTKRDSIISRSYIHADKYAELEILSDIPVFMPAFGKPYRLISCKIQSVKPLETDNIYFYKDNERYYREQRERSMKSTASSSIKPSEIGNLRFFSLRPPTTSSQPGLSPAPKLV